MFSFPTISVNSDSIMRFRPVYVSYDTTGKDLKSIRFPYDGNRKIILAAATNGTTISIGLHSKITEDPVDDGGGNWSIADAVLETDVVGSGKLVIPALTNIASMIPGSISILFDGVKVAQDDALGHWVGTSLLPDQPLDLNFPFESTINYAGGVSALYFVVEPNPTVISIEYTSITADTATALSVIGTAPLDLSAFLKNAPYSYFETNKDIVISPATDNLITIAYTEVKG